MPRWLSFDVVDGSRGGFTLSLWLASPAAGCAGRTTMTRSWSPSSAGVGMFGERAGGSCRGPGTGCGRRPLGEWRGCAEWNETAGPAGVGACGGRTGCRDGCDEPLERGGGQGRGVGPVWFGANRVAGGHFAVLGFAGGGLAGGEVVTRLSQRC